MKGETDSHTIRPVHGKVGENLGMCLERGRSVTESFVGVTRLAGLTRISQRKVLELVRFLKTSSRLTALTLVGRRERSDTRVSNEEERWNMASVAIQVDDSELLMPVGYDEVYWLEGRCELIMTLQTEKRCCQSNG